MTWALMPGSTPSRSGSGRWIEPMPRSWRALWAHAEPEGQGAGDQGVGAGRGRHR